MNKDTTYQFHIKGTYDKKRITINRLLLDISRELYEEESKDKRKRYIKVDTNIIELFL